MPSVESLARHTYRVVAAVFLFAAFALPAAAHVHRGHDRGVGLSVSMPAAHLVSRGASARVSHCAGERASNAVHRNGCCTTGCACCVSLPVPETEPVGRSWLYSRLVGRLADGGHTDAVLEKFPKPPKSFA